MINTGLVSITFRKLGVEEIIKLVVKAGLDGIEWGGDIHVPHGDTVRAAEVCKMTADAGLKVAAYGSYYSVGCKPEGAADFDRVLETAVELKAPTIRVWAGNRGSAESDEGWFEIVVSDAARIAGMAEKAGLSVSFEYHGGTLTDTPQSADRLFEEIDSRSVYSYWQPQSGLSMDENLYGLRRIASRLGNVHVFHWLQHDRMPLREGLHEWQSYLEFIKGVDGDRYCMLEFVREDSPEQFLHDAEILRKLVYARQGGRE